MYLPMLPNGRARLRVYIVFARTRRRRRIRRSLAPSYTDAGLIAGRVEPRDSRTETFFSPEPAGRLDWTGLACCRRLCAEGEDERADSNYSASHRRRNPFVVLCSSVLDAWTFRACA